MSKYDEGDIDDSRSNHNDAESNDVANPRGKSFVVDGRVRLELLIKTL